jgi:hypothetical protein
MVRAGIEALSPGTNLAGDANGLVTVADSEKRKAAES